MDLSKYGLEGDVLAQAQADLDAHVKGLKDKNTELISREKAQKDANQELTLKLETEAENAKVLLAEKEGSVEQYKNAVAERDQKIETIQREFKETENARVMDSAVNEFSTVLADDPAGRMYMQKQFKDMIDIVDGKAQPKDVTFGDIESLTQKLVSDDANAKYIRADVGSGSGSQGGHNGYGKAKPFNEMTATEKAIFANQNPVEYSQMTNR